MNRILTAFASAAVTFASVAATGPMVINVKPSGKKDMTVELQRAIDRAARQKGRPVEIRLAPGEYHISRAKSTPQLIYVSNTTTPQENPDPTKHIGLYMKGISNLTIDGGGANIVTHGEMTPWVIQGCENVTLKNFSIDAADPSLPEMTVTSVTDSTLVAKVNSRSTYSIRGGKLYWTGEGWEFTDGIAQIYNPKDTTSLRIDSPVAFSSSVTELEPGTLKFSFKPRKMGDLTGMTYQMRHSYRTEVAGLIWESKGVTLSDINFHFMGNFGVVAQFSTDINYRNLTCAPDPASGRTGAGFADFFQVSGCKGQVNFSGCTFAGAHDDPINVHGTHLRIIESPRADLLKLRFMHAQTRGFQAFYPGDTVAVVNPASLLREFTAVVKEAVNDDDFNMTVTLDRPVPQKVLAVKNAVLENVTWSPAVDIRDCYFTLTPTRGILMTTWRPVVIENNTFFRCPMSAVLIADDARSWYESGPVQNVVIRGNKFIDCVNPVISIAPEVSRAKGPVHENITVADNVFQLTGRFPAARVPELRARLVKGLTVTGNTVLTPDGAENQASLRVITDGCSPVTIR